MLRRLFTSKLGQERSCFDKILPPLCFCTPNRWGGASKIRSPAYIDVTEKEETLLNICKKSWCKKCRPIDQAADTGV